jgi:hypothetical protein
MSFSRVCPPLRFDAIGQFAAHERQHFRAQTAAAIADATVNFQEHFDALRRRQICSSHQMFGMLATAR